GCRAQHRPAASPPAGATTPPAPPPRPDPLVAELDAERRLLAGYDATSAAHPALAARLAPLRADHVAPAAALDRALGRRWPPAPPAKPATRCSCDEGAGMSSDPVPALQVALAAEHAVIWGYAVAGAHLDVALREEVWLADAAHRGRRDATAALVRGYGAD